MASGDYPRCGANRSSGGTCGKPAGWGTPNKTGRCKLHGGMTPTHLMAAQKLQAQNLAGIYGIPRQVDPRDGIIEEYARSAGIVTALEQIVSTIPQADLVWGVVEEQDGVGDGDSGPMRKVTSKAVPNAWVKLLNEERDRFRQLGVDIIKLGLEARRDEWMRQNGMKVSDVFRRAITRAGIPAETAKQLMDALVVEISDEVTRLAGQAVAA